MQTCPIGYFKCKTLHQCIDGKKTCNLTPDCVDSSDERDCTCRDFLARKDPKKACDSHPDCPNYEDERNCKFCPPNNFYCDISKQCVARNKVCNQKIDCKFGEDERYCLNLINTDSVFLTQSGRPQRTRAGFVAFNSGSKWALMCAQGWNAELNNKICSYMGYKRGESFSLISSNRFPLMRYKVLKVKLINTTRTVFDRNAVETLDDGNDRDKRQAEKVCNYIQTKCSEATACGTMPLYSNLGAKTPFNGPGAFPWHVNLYRQGEYFCGATLVHRFWILTSTKCANQVKPHDWIIARAGGYRDLFSLSAHDQLRRVVHFSSIPGTSISLGFLGTPFDLNEYVNVVCIPTVSWIPIRRQCFITGKQGETLNYAFKTRVTKTCQYRNQNHYSMCTEQVS